MRVKYEGKVGPADGKLMTRGIAVVRALGSIFFTFRFRLHPGSYVS